MGFFFNLSTQNTSLETQRAAQFYAKSISPGARPFLAVRRIAAFKTRRELPAREINWKLLKTPQGNPPKVFCDSIRLLVGKPSAMAQAIESRREGEQMAAREIANHLSLSLCSSWCSLPALSIIPLTQEKAVQEGLRYFNRKKNSSVPIFL